ncbi:MAG: NAD-dependent epimerase/dehydratase family protein [Planctomycetota bacterium]
MAPRILITGATGFVGSSLARLLAERGYELRCLLRPTSKAENLRGLRYERVEATLADGGRLEEALTGVDRVVHLAALVSFRKQDAVAMHRVNVAGTARLAGLARQKGVGRFLHVSSVVAVGFSRRPETIDERAAYNFGPLRVPYCDTKRAAERAVLAEVARGLDAVIVNPASMFGPGDRRKADGSLLQAMAEGRVPVCPPGGCNFVDVRDVAQGCVAALERGRTGERYILGGENLSGRELLAKIARVLGRAPPRITLPRVSARAIAMLASAWELFRPLEPPVTAQILRMSPLFLWYSSRKAREELGYAAYPVEIAIKATIDWMLDLDLLDPRHVRSGGRL